VVQVLRLVRQMDPRGDVADPIAESQVVAMAALASMRSPALGGSTTKLA
jgi:hypothetical protein